MITNDGKAIIGRFLLGQIPEYATHIVAGCGRMPLFSTQTITATGSGSVEYANQKIRKALEFESFRVPIVSKGIINEDGQEKIVIQAEAPTEQNFLISEIGFISSGKNTIAGDYDSKLISSFSSAEGWQIVSASSSQTISLLTESSLYDANGITVPLSCFISNNDSLFNITSRIDKRELPRFYNQSLLQSGSAAYIDSSFSSASATYWIENSSTLLDLSQNSSDDEIKLAICVLNKSNSVNTNPDKVRVIIELVNNVAGLNSLAPKAKATKEILSSEFIVSGTGQSTDPTNRYIVIKKKLSEFTKDSGFSWANINLIRIYASVINSSELRDSDFYIIYDGIRFDNVSTDNPTYGLVGYSIVKSINAYPIVKLANSSSLIEYRFIVGAT